MPKSPIPLPSQGTWPTKLHARSEGGPFTTWPSLSFPHETPYPAYSGGTGTPQASMQVPKLKPSV